MDKAKSFCISKREVLDAYKKVKANGGAAGVDGQSIEEFEKDWKNNLYKLWNRMSSGSYFPQPVRRVDIPKGDGRTRPLGIPTISDRIAQTVVKVYLESKVDKEFHPDSYGYRPGKSAIDAVGRARERCWRNDWVLEIDVRAFFDNIDHELMMRAVRKHTDSPWMLLYIERWLKAPVQMQDGSLVNREKGTPQGGAISPLLANLFLHYAFDRWMMRNHPHTLFERFADDMICHCKTEVQAQKLRKSLEQRFAQCGLELHPEKTKIVYCKDTKRRGNYPNEKFDFLGYTFRTRESRNWRGEYFVSFSPAVSTSAANEFRGKIRRLHLSRNSDKSLGDLAREVNSVLRGWVNYFKHFYKSAMCSVFRYIDWVLVKWAMRKYKRFRGHQWQAARWLRRIVSRQPGLFAHWRFLHVSAGL